MSIRGGNFHSFWLASRKGSRPRNSRRADAAEGPLAGMLRRVCGGCYQRSHNPALEGRGSSRPQLQIFAAGTPAESPYKKREELSNNGPALSMAEGSLAQKAAFDLRGAALPTGCRIYFSSLRGTGATHLAHL